MDYALYEQSIEDCSSNVKTCPYPDVTHTQKYTRVSLHFSGGQKGQIVRRKKEPGDRANKKGRPPNGYIIVKIHYFYSCG